MLVVKAGDALFKANSWSASPNNFWAYPPRAWPISEGACIDRDSLTSDLRFSVAGRDQARLSVQALMTASD